MKCGEKNSPEDFSHRKSMCFIFFCWYLYLIDIWKHSHRTLHVPLFMLAETKKAEAGHQTLIIIFRLVKSLKSSYLQKSFLVFSLSMTYLWKGWHWHFVVLISIYILTLSRCLWVFTNKLKAEQWAALSSPGRLTVTGNDNGASDELLQGRNQQCTCAWIVNLYKNPPWLFYIWLSSRNPSVIF